MSTAQQKHAKRALIGYIIGCVITLFLIILILSYALNHKVLKCSYEYDYDNKSSDEISIKMVWNYGKLVEAKTTTYFKTPEQITDYQIAKFKQEFEAGDYYENIEYADFFSYQVKATADYKLDKIRSLYGGDDYDTVRASLVDNHQMTCNK